MKHFSVYGSVTPILVSIEWLTHGTSRIEIVLPKIRQHLRKFMYIVHKLIGIDNSPYTDFSFDEIIKTQIVLGLYLVTGIGFPITPDSFTTHTNGAPRVFIDSGSLTASSPEEEGETPQAGA